MQKETNGNSSWIIKSLLVGAATLLLMFGGAIAGYTISEIKENTTQIVRVADIHSLDMKEINSRVGTLETKVALDSVTLANINKNLIEIKATLKAIQMNKGK